MTPRDMMAKITSDNDQDREAAKQWMREATPADRMDLWTTIQRRYDEPCLEIMSRFAQLAFGEILVEVDQEAKE